MASIFPSSLVLLVRWFAVRMATSELGTRIQERESDRVSSPTTRFRLILFHVYPAPFLPFVSQFPLLHLTFLQDRIFLSNAVGTMSRQPQPSSSSVRPEEPPKLERIKRMLGPFRMLIIGRANAGKTTILQRICNSTEHPKIFDDSGNEVSGRPGFVE